MKSIGEKYYEDIAIYIIFIDYYHLLILISIFQKASLLWSGKVGFH